MVGLTPSVLLAAMSLGLDGATMSCDAVVSTSHIRLSQWYLILPSERKRTDARVVRQTAMAK